MKLGIELDDVNMSLKLNKYWSFLFIAETFFAAFWLIEGIVKTFGG